ncbi:kelch domain-containing protein 10 [Eucyclogobius newberryi]|uniref:kelch domain-containing protein 10 n=1 Tax=Eucyclogobius newberryi TaxID=166745 RepID=UPI003B58E5D7
MSQSGPCLWTRLPQSSPAPCERFKLACCSHQQYVYVLGGRHSTCQRDFWSYNVVCNEWAELNCTSDAAPEALEEHSMVAHEGSVLVFGGMLDCAYSSLRCPLWVFDVMKQKWVHWHGKSPQTESPSNRKGHSAVVIGSNMLLYGGYIDLKGSSQEFWSLDLDSMVWSPLSCSPQSSLGPGPRHSHACAAFQSCMYLYGGLKGLREQRDFWMWNSSSSTWSSLKTKCGPSKLVGHSAVTYRDCMLVFGGRDGQNFPQNVLWRYNFSSQSWNQITALPNSSPPPKIDHCCAGLGPSYRPRSQKPASNPGHQTQLEDKIRRFKNKCFPARLSFLGSENEIELQPLTPERSNSPDKTEKEWRMDCLTFENKALKNRWSFEEEMDVNISQHLPDMLLVVGGRPCTPHTPISVWQMTLADS